VVTGRLWTCHPPGTIRCPGDGRDVSSSFLPPRSSCKICSSASSCLVCRSASISCSSVPPFYEANTATFLVDIFFASATSSHSASSLPCPIYRANSCSTSAPARNRQDRSAGPILIPSAVSPLKESLPQPTSLIGRDLIWMDLQESLRYPAQSAVRASV
jgi:hypothetical protein